MEAIFDRKGLHVAWINKDDGMIYNTIMNWIGFVQGSYFFDTSCNWLGGWNDGIFVDKKGKPIGWTQNHIPIGGTVLCPPIKPLKPIPPLTPLRPITPIRPFKPFTPIGGWSEKEWSSLWR